MEDSLNHALDPNHLNAEKHKPPEEAGDETKAIPIITDNESNLDGNEDTIIHQPNAETKNVPSKNNKQKKKTKKKQKKKWLIIFLVLFLLLGASVVVAFFVSQQDRKSVV